MTNTLKQVSIQWGYQALLHLVWPNVCLLDWLCSLARLLCFVLFHTSVSLMQSSVIVVCRLQFLRAEWMWYSLSLIAYANASNAHWRRSVYDMYSCMHNNAIYSSSITLGRLINLKCKCVPSMFNQLTMRVKCVVKVMFPFLFLPISYYTVHHHVKAGLRFKAMDSI